MGDWCCVRKPDKDIINDKGAYPWWLGFVVSTDGLNKVAETDYDAVDLGDPSNALNPDTVLVHECAISIYEERRLESTAWRTCDKKAVWSKGYRNREDKGLFLALNKSAGQHKTFTPLLRTVDVNSIAEFAVPSKIINKSGTVNHNVLKSLHINSNVKWWGLTQILDRYPAPLPNPYAAR